MAEMSEVLKNFQKHGFEASYFETSEAAVAYLADKIKKKSVGFGGAVTLRQIGLYEALEKENAVVWHWKSPNAEATYRLAQTTQVYVTSANGVSATGELVNIDGSGNRVAATAFGPKEIYYVVGVNKIEDTLEKAIYRAKNIAGPKNAQRLSRKTPCAVKGDKCYDCDSPERICRVTAITERKPFFFDKAEVIIINEDLGF